MNPALRSDPIFYPDSDGRRMAENTLQAQWIITLFCNLELLFADRADVFVAMDNLWYPVEGKPKRRAAPDVYLAFNRPKGHRGSYKQWVEGGVPLTVVFEVLSPGNRLKELIRKFRFYERYGAEEYYVIDPDRHTFEAWHRVGDRLQPVKVDGSSTSPRMGVGFAWKPGSDVVVSYPDGKPFQSVQEIDAARQAAEKNAEAAAKKAEAAAKEAEAAAKEAAAATTRAEASDKKAAAFAAKLRELGIDPDTV